MLNTPNRGAGRGWGTGLATAGPARQSGASRLLSDLTRRHQLTCSTASEHRGLATVFGSDAPWNWHVAGAAEGTPAS